MFSEVVLTANRMVPSVFVQSAGVISKWRACDPTWASLTSLSSAMRELYMSIGTCHSRTAWSCVHRLHGRTQWYVLSAAVKFEDISPSRSRMAGTDRHVQLAHCWRLWRQRRWGRVASTSFRYDAGRLNKNWWYHAIRRKKLPQNIYF